MGLRDSCCVTKTHSYRPPFKGQIIMLPSYTQIYAAIYSAEHSLGNFVFERGRERESESERERVRERAREHEIASEHERERVSRHDRASACEREREF